MSQRYSGHGLRFRYPESWQLSEEAFDDCVTVTVASDTTVYWCASVFGGRPQIEHVLETAGEALESEYEDLDREEHSTDIGPYRAVGQRYEFLCLDLVNTVELQAFRTGRFTVLIMIQGVDTDMEQHRETLEEITASLMCDPADDLLLG